MTARPPHQIEAGVSVVVLSYNRPALLDDALQTIHGQSSRPDEVIVVDNPSSSSPAIKALVARFPGTIYYSPSRNLGFAGGMNAGVKLSSCEYVFLTEDDITVDPEAIGLLKHAAASARGLDFFGTSMFKRTSGQPHFARGRIVPEVGFMLVAESEVSPPPEAVYSTGYLSGASMFGRRDAFLRMGPFYEPLFMYSEDVDFSMRVLAAGGSLHIVRDARVSHADPPLNAGVNPTVEFHKFKNRLALHVLHNANARLPLRLCGSLRDAILDACSGRWSSARSRTRAVRWLVANYLQLRRDRVRKHVPCT